MATKLNQDSWDNYMKEAKILGLQEVLYQDAGQKILKSYYKIPVISLKDPTNSILGQVPTPPRDTFDFYLNETVWGVMKKQPVTHVIDHTKDQAFVEYWNDYDEVCDNAEEFDTSEDIHNVPSKFYLRIGSRLYLYAMQSGIGSCQSLSNNEHAYYEMSVFSNTPDILQSIPEYLDTKTLSRLYTRLNSSLNLVSDLQKKSDNLDHKDQLQVIDHKVDLAKAQGRLEVCQEEFDHFFLSRSQDKDIILADLKDKFASYRHDSAC